MMVRQWLLSVKSLFHVEGIERANRYMVIETFEKNGNELELIIPTQSLFSIWLAI